MSPDTRLSLAISIKIALNRLPWLLLKATEKGARDRLETERRNAYLAEVIIREIELSKYEIKPGPGAGHVVNDARIDHD